MLFISLREQPFDFYERGQEDVFGPGYFFHSQNDSVFLFAYITDCTIEFTFAW